MIYAVISKYGFISTAPGYGQPLLVKCRDHSQLIALIDKYDLTGGNVNNRCWRITAKEAYSNYSRIVDGIRTFDHVVLCSELLDDFMIGCGEVII